MWICGYLPKTGCLRKHRGTRLRDIMRSYPPVIHQKLKLSQVIHELIHIHIHREYLPCAAIHRKNVPHRWPVKGLLALVALVLLPINRPFCVWLRCRIAVICWGIQKRRCCRVRFLVGHTFRLVKLSLRETGTQWFWGLDPTQEEGYYSMENLQNSY